jgi:sRNA-binding regulator protein Hfq
MATSLPMGFEFALQGVRLNDTVKSFNNGVIIIGKDEREVIYGCGRE